MSDVGKPPRFLRSTQTFFVQPQTQAGTTSSFLDAGLVAKISRESADAAREVISQASVGNSRAIDLAGLEVTQYAPSTSHSSSVSAPFFSDAGEIDHSVRRDISRQISLGIDSVDVSWSRGASVDSSTVSVKMSILASDLPSLKAVRLFRHDLGPDETAVPLTRAGISVLSTERTRKSIDVHPTLERVLRERGQLGGLEQVARDPILNIRTTEGSGSSFRTAVVQNDLQGKIATARLQGMVPAEIAAKVDPSIAFDLRVVSRIGVPVDPARELVVGKGAEQDPTAKAFREVSVVSAFSLRTVDVGGGFVQFTLVDPSTVRGSRYSYYAVPVDSQGRNGKRTPIVSAVIDSGAPPTPPTGSISTDGRHCILQFVNAHFAEMFELYRSEANGPWSLVAVIPAAMGGASFVDRAVVPGRSYSYRVYTVDHLRNKSQRFEQLSVSVRVDKSPAGRPAVAVHADVDQLSRLVSVRADVSDPTIRALVFTRRDTGVGQRAFVSPDCPDIPSLSPTDGKRGFNQGVCVPPTERYENGYVPVVGTGSYVFSDKLSKLDHSYQYCVYGVDENGRRTHKALSRIVFLSNRPIISAPIHLSASVTGEGIRIFWFDSNPTVTPGDMLGDREELSATSVRNLYQVQRRERDASRWEDFPLIDTASFFDPFKTGAVQNRPAYPQGGHTYLYRVATFQTGGYYSNFTEPLSVGLIGTPEPPGRLDVRCSATNVRPITLVVNWDNPTDGHWSVERSVVNSLAAARIKGEDAIAALSFSHVADVAPEGSRGNPHDLDAVRKRNPALFTGRRFYIDHNVSPGNSYFYRVTSVSRTGLRSVPSYAVMPVSSVPNNRQIDLMLSAADREMLSESRVPLKISAPKSTDVAFKSLSLKGVDR